MTENCFSEVRKRALLHMLNSLLPFFSANQQRAPRCLGWAQHTMGNRGRIFTCDALIFPNTSLRICMHAQEYTTQGSCMPVRQ